MYFLGIDGGGTKTQFTLVDQAGNIIAETTSDTIYFLSIGLDSVCEILNAGIDLILKKSRISSTEIKATCIGLPGFGDVGSNEKELTEVIRQNLPIENILIFNDAKLGWAGSLACNSGINIVAGTGSIAYGVDDEFNENRSGGWGYQIGGDEGSAYWIGSRLIEAFTKQSDGRHEKTLLYGKLKESLNLNKDFQILDILLNKSKSIRKEMAAFSIFACQMASAGDPVAIGIFEDAAKELFLLVKSLKQRMEFKEPVRVSYSGGVFNSGTLILQSFQTYLKSINAVLEKPQFTPSIGACLLACKSVMGGLEINMLKRLKENTNQ